MNPRAVRGLVSALFVRDAAIAAGNIQSIKDRISGQTYTAVNICPYTAADATLGGAATTTTAFEVGFTFGGNLVPPGTDRTVVFIGRCTTADGATLLQMGGENTHRVALVRINAGGYLAVGGVYGLVTGNGGAVDTSAKCTIYKVSAGRAVAVDEGTGNQVLAGSPMTADDTGSTVSGGALLTQIPGIFSMHPYVLACMLVYNRILTSADDKAIRKWAALLYRTS